MTVEFADTNANRHRARGIAWRWWGVVLMLVVAFFVGRISGWGLRRFHVAQRQQEIVAAVQSLEGIVYYDDQVRFDRSHELLLNEDNVAGWAGRKGGIVRNVFHDVFYITFAEFVGSDGRLLVRERTEVNDALLKDICELRELHWLSPKRHIHHRQRARGGRRRAPSGTTLAQPYAYR